MTTGQQLIAQGRVEGRVEGRAELLLESLTIRFGNIDTQTSERIHSASPEQISAWNRRLLAGATTLEDVLA